MAQELILIRHGSIGAEHAGRYIGVTDIPLAPDGQAQAQRLSGRADEWAGARCISSPLARARETAEIALGGSVPEIWTELREIDFGTFEQCTWGEIAERDPIVVSSWLKLPDQFAFGGGETVGAFLARIDYVLQRVAEAPEEQVVAFTHAGLIRWLICRALGLARDRYLAFSVEYASITRLRWDGRHGVLLCLNDIAHLEAR